MSLVFNFYSFTVTSKHYSVVTYDISTTNSMDTYFLFGSFSNHSFSTVNICQGAVVKAKNQVISADSTAGLTVNLLGGSVISENADTGVFTLPDEQYKVNILSGHIEGGKRIISKTTNRKDNLEYPEGKTSVDYNISASDQINIRFANNSSGLRFETLISAEVIALAEALKDADSEISYGTVITPAENLAAANGIIDMSVLENIDANGTKYIRVKAKDGKIDNADGSVTVPECLRKYLGVDIIKK